MVKKVVFDDQLDGSGQGIFEEQQDSGNTGTTLTPTTAPPIPSGSASLSAIGLLEFLGIKKASNEALLEGVVSNLAEGIKEASGQVALLAHSMLSAQGIKVAYGDLLISSVGAVTASGSVIATTALPTTAAPTTTPPITGDAFLSAVAGVVVQGYKEGLGTSDITSIGNVSFGGQKHAYDEAVITALAILNAAGNVVTPAGEALLSAIGHAQASGFKHAFLEAEMMALASLSGLGIKEGFGSASMSAVASLIASGIEGLPAIIRNVIELQGLLEKDVSLKGVSDRVVLLEGLLRRYYENS